MASKELKEHFTSRDGVYCQAIKASKDLANMTANSSRELYQTDVYLPYICSIGFLSSSL